MITEGLKLIVLGMGTVFVFLTLLLLAIKVMARLLAPFTTTEMLELEAEQQAAAARRQQPAADTGDGRTLIAVISAAVATHRARR